MIFTNQISMFFSKNNQYRSSVLVVILGLHFYYYQFLPIELSVTGVEVSIRGHTSHEHRNVRLGGRLDQLARPRRNVGLGPHPVQVSEYLH